MNQERAQNEEEIITKAPAAAAQALSESEESALATLKPYVDREPEKDQIFACFELFSMQNYAMTITVFM